MKRLQVSVSDTAKLQVREQVLFIAQDSIENALAWEDRLSAILNGLGEFCGHALDEEAIARVGGKVRKIVFEKTYLIHYEVNEAIGIVEVLNFRHGARLPRTDEP